jgi:multiple sugar transport system ATP-binding protein
MSELTLKGLTKRYDDGTLAVDGLDLEIGDGEMMILVGPSGCGKTTALRMIAGLEEITEGELWLDGQIVNEFPPKSRDMAMVFQNYALYPHMSVRQNMSFGLEQAKLDKGEIARRVEEAAQTLDLTEHLDRKPGHLSGGQRQRVAMGRAIVRDPKAFLMDEPLSNLDAKLRTQMRTELARIQGDLGTTTVYVTHDQIEAMGAEYYAYLDLPEHDAVRDLAGMNGATAADADVDPVARHDAGQLVARLPLDSEVRERAPITLRFDPGRVHVFDPRSGRRLTDADA